MGRDRLTCLRSVGVVILHFSCTMLLGAIQPGAWKTYTSKKEVRGVILRDGVLWAATSGGMFSFTVADGAIQEYTTSEGLRSNNLSAIAVDTYGNVWTGAISGILHSYTPSLRVWKYVTDIARDNAPGKQINAFIATGDTLYIASEIGLSEYLISRDEFQYTVRVFGGASPLTGQVTGVALFHDSVWVSTANGIAATSRSSSNPSAPDSWSVDTSGLTVSSLVVFRGTLYASTTQGIVRRNGGTWMSILGTSGMNILRMAVQNDSMFFITSTGLFALDSAEAVSAIFSSFASSLSSLAIDGAQVMVGSTGSGVFARGDGTWQAVIPKGPPTNHMVGIAVDSKGVLWAATGPTSNEGFFSFNGKEWSVYTTQQYPILGGNNYYKVSIGKDNGKWVSSWGSGVALIDDEGLLRKLLNGSSGLLPTVGSDTAFVVVGGVATDGQGRAWITNRTPPCSTASVVFEPDSSFSYITGKCLRNPVTIFTDVVIDDNGTKWFANFNRFEPVAPRGLFFYNERMNLPGTSGGWGQLTTSDGLPSNYVWSLAVDLQGQLWIGSDKGITIIFDTSNPRNRMASYHPLGDQIIEGIAVDPLNNKWVAAKQGVFLLSPDGTSITAQYTVENTDGKLVDNELQSVAVDFKTGTVYFGSEKGLSALTTTAVAPVRSLDDLLITPNPFYVPASSSITIDGLVQNSSLKILSIDGKVIKNLKTPGGRVGFWDGRDIHGNVVSSGIYIIVAYSENGNQVAAGKVAVLRR